MSHWIVSIIVGALLVMAGFKILCWILGLFASASEGVENAMKALNKFKKWLTPLRAIICLIVAIAAIVAFVHFVL